MPPGDEQGTAQRHGRTAHRVRLLLTVLAFAAAIGPTTLRTVSTFDVPAATDATPNGMGDFRDAIYYPTAAYLAGVNPYGPGYRQFHPRQSEFPLFSPLTFLVHLPFGLLPYSWAAGLYYALQVLLIVVLARLLLGVCGIDTSWPAVFGVAAVIAISRPVHVNMVLGQLGLTMMLGCLLALDSGRSKPWLAGLGLALVTIKPNYAVPLVVLMLCRRHFRAVVTGLIMSGAATAVVTTVLVARAGSLTEFVHQLLATYGSLAQHPGLASIDGAGGRIDALSIVLRFSSLPPPGSVKLVVFFGCLLLAGGAVLRLSQRPNEQGADGLSAAVICLCVLTCIYHNSYDAALLFIPAMAVAAGRNPTWRHMGNRARWALAGLLALPLLNYVSTRQVTQRLLLDGGALDFVMSINSVVIFSLFVALAGWALVLDRHGSAAISRKTPRA